MADVTGNPSVFRHDLQGLRALAVVLVVLYHADVPGFSGGFIGVDVFFVISGYVIGGSLWREQTARGSISLKAFFARRVRRLVPAFVVASLGALVVTALFVDIGADQSNAAWTALAATFSVANFFLYATGDRYFAPTEEGNPFLHMWSLDVEEQFYLVVPALIVALVALSRRTRWSSRTVTLWSVSALAAASLVASQHWVSTGSDRWAFYSPFGRFWEMAIGVALALVPTLRAPGVLAWPALGGIVLGSVVYDSATSFPGTTALLPVISTAVLIAAAPNSALAQRVLGHRTVGWLGDRSYSWYLWHWPFIVAAMAFTNSWVVLLVVASASLVPAAWSYRFVEEPFRRSAGWAQRVRRPRLVAGAAPVVVCVTSLGIVAGASTSWGLPKPNEPSRLAFENGCHAESDWDVESCTFRPDGESRGTVMLFGDSHAAELAEGARAAVVDDLGYTFITVTVCPFIELPTRSDICGPYLDLAWQLVEAIEPDLVIISHRSTRYTWSLSARADDAPLSRDASGTVVRSRDHAIDAWAEGLSLTRSRLESTGTALLSVDVVPEFDANIVSSVPLAHRAVGRPAVVELDRSEFERRRSAVIAAEHAVLDHWIDPVPVLCPRFPCTPRGDDGEWLYLDDNHVSAAGSVALRALLAEGVTRALTDGAGS